MRLGQFKVSTGHNEVELSSEVPNQFFFNDLAVKKSNKKESVSFTVKKEKRLKTRRKGVTDNRQTVFVRCVSTPR